MIWGLLAISTGIALLVQGNMRSQKGRSGWVAAHLPGRKAGESMQSSAVPRPISLLPEAPAWVDGITGPWVVHLISGSEGFDIADFRKLRFTALLLGLLGGLIVFLILGTGSVWFLPLAAGLFLLVFFAPDIWLFLLGRDARELRDRQIPSFLDLLAIHLRSAAGHFDASFTEVASAIPSPLGRYLGTAVRQIEAGLPREEALRGLAATLRSDDLRELAAAVTLSMQFGHPIAPVVSRVANEARRHQLQRAERRAQLVGLFLLLPLTLFILPSLLAVMLGPALLTIVKTLGG